MQKPKSLADKIRNQEQQETQSKISKAAAVTRITTNGIYKKDKVISAKVNARTYAIYTKINQAQGITNNSALNMLINKYVRENSGILPEFEKMD